MVNPVGERPDVLYDAALLSRLRVALRTTRTWGSSRWYLPSVADVEDDLAMLRRIGHFRADGDEFDGVALDLENTTDVPDVAVRNDRIVNLTKRTARAARR